MNDIGNYNIFIKLLQMDTRQREKNTAYIKCKYYEL